MSRTITFNELRRIKNRLPEGSIHDIADKLNLPVQSVRNYFGGSKIYSNQMAGMVSRMGRYFSADASKPVIVPNGRQQQLIFIAVLICAVPLIILYIFTQRTFVESLAMTGSKE